MRVLFVCCEAGRWAQAWVGKQARVQQTAPGPADHPPTLPYWTRLLPLFPQPLRVVHQLQDLLGAVAHIDACMRACVGGSELITEMIKWKGAVPRIDLTS